MTVLTRDDQKVSNFTKLHRFLRYQAEETLILFSMGIVAIVNILEKIPFKLTLAFLCGSLLIIALLTL